MRPPVGKVRLHDPPHTPPRRETNLAGRLAKGQGGFQGTRQAMSFLAGPWPIKERAVSAYGQDDKDLPTSPDTAIYNSLRDVINRGADVYNRGDPAGCYRIFEGSLTTLKPLLGHRPDLQKVIGTALANADADPVVWR